MPVVESILTIMKVVGGICFIIFVHELGHFLAAKKVGIRVLTFSLGFGPRVFGFKKGDTDYRLSALPLGGYVKMAGETPGELKSGSDDEFNSKTVGQRALVLSAGVIMNLISALFIFPLAFRIGIPYTEPMVGMVTEGGPAWMAGIETGDRIVGANGKPVYKFDDIPIYIALCDPEVGVALDLERDGEKKSVRVYPEMDKERGIYAIGLSPQYEFDVEPDSDASAAGLQNGDFPISINGKDTRGSLARIATLIEPGKKTELRVDRDGEVVELELTPSEKEAGGFFLGVSPVFNVVKAVRPESLLSGLSLKSGDIVVSCDDRPIYEPNDLMNAAVAAGAGGTLHLVVNRDGEQTNETVQLPATGKPDAFLKGVAFQMSEGTRIRPAPGSAAVAAGLVPGDRILKLDGLRVDKFEDVRSVMDRYSGDVAMDVSYERGGETILASITPGKRMQSDAGIILRARNYIYQEANVLGAVRAGIQNTGIEIVRVFLVLRKMFTGSVSPKNLGGPVTIAKTTYQFAEGGFSRLLYILGILSINLAVFNLLPIPVLDGGQLLFLGIEKIKGSPVSDRVLGVFQWAGLLFILALLLFVTFNDIQRIVD